MKILLVEDDYKLLSLIQTQLQKQKHIVDTCAEGDVALTYVLSKDTGYDIILLDRMLPVIDGLTILSAMRKKNINIPVIIITGIDEVNEKIIALDCGADDYITKPFHIDELSARIRALARRPSDLQNPDKLSFGNISLDIQNRLLSSGSNTVLLTQKETDLLAALINAENCPLTREQLLLKVWGIDAEVETGNIDNYVYFLRRRLKSIECKIKIKSIYGKGFQLYVDD